MGIDLLDSDANGFLGFGQDGELAAARDGGVEQIPLQQDIVLLNKHIFRWETEVAMW